MRVVETSVEVSIDGAAGNECEESINPALQEIRGDHLASCGNLSRQRYTPGKRGGKAGLNCQTTG